MSDDTKSLAAAARARAKVVGNITSRQLLNALADQIERLTLDHVVLHETAVDAMRSARVVRTAKEHDAILAMSTAREALAAWMTANGYATGHGDTVEDLLRELDWQHRERVNGWRDIASAPKDGSVCLLLGCGYTKAADEWSPEIVFGPRVAIGRWNPSGDSWVNEHGLTGGDCVYLAITGTWSSDGGWFQPNEVSHWMPLPEPPLPRIGEEVGGHD